MATGAPLAVPRQAVGTHAKWEYSFALPCLAVRIAKRMRRREDSRPSPGAPLAAHALDRVGVGALRVRVQRTLVVRDPLRAGPGRPARSTSLTTYSDGACCATSGVAVRRTTHKMARGVRSGVCFAMRWGRAQHVLRVAKAGLPHALRTMRPRSCDGGRVQTGGGSRRVCTPGRPPTGQTRSSSGRLRCTPAPPTRAPSHKRWGAGASTRSASVVSNRYIRIHKQRHH
jgi:hypothetical protein